MKLEDSQRGGDVPRRLLLWHGTFQGCHFNGQNAAAFSSITFKTCSTDFKGLSRFFFHWGSCFICGLFLFFGRGLSSARGSYSPEEGKKSSQRV